MMKQNEKNQFQEDFNKQGGKHPSFRFRRFTGKRYAAFASLGKQVCIGVLFIGCSLLTLKTQPVLAQGGYKSSKTLMDSTLNIEGVEITAKPNVPIEPLVQILSVLDKKELSRAGVQNFQDVLRYVQGLDIRSRGGENVQADVSLRGATFDQFIILLNGINFSDPQTGHFSLNLPINFLDIQRIEVLQGAGAWAYNAAPFAAVLNIITDLDYTNYAKIQASGGLYGYYQGEASANFTKKKWTIHGSSGYSASDGYAPNTDFGIWNNLVRIRYADPEKTGIFSAQVGYQSKDFGANSFYSTRYRDQYEATRAIVSSLDYKKQWKTYRLQAGLYFRQHHDRFELFRDKINAPDFYLDHNYHRSDLGGAQLNFAYAWKGGTTSLGANYRYEHLFSNALGNFMKESKGKFTKAAERQYGSVHLQHIWENKSWKIGGGLMLNANNDYGAKIFGGLSAEYLIHKFFSLEAFVNHAYRMPSFTDLYYNSPTQIGNTNLLPEQAVNSEISLRYKQKEFSAKVGVFHRYAFSVIDWVRLADEEVWFSKNLTNLHTIGSEISFGYSPYTPYFHFIRLDYTYIHVSKQAGEYISLYATDYLRHQFKLSVAHGLFKSLSAQWIFILKDRAGSYMEITEMVEKNYRPYLLCDLKISWLKPRYEVFAIVNNLFNAKYFDLGNLPQAGIWLKLGASVRFGKS